MNIGKVSENLWRKTIGTVDSDMIRKIGESAVNTYDGWMQHNPDYRVKG